MEAVEVSVPARTSPISEAERDLLLGLIKEEKVLQNRSTDGKIVVLKRQAWARVLQDFNAHNLGPKRTELQLKRIRERLKVKAKQEHAVKRREQMKTGGGPPPTEIPKDADKILNILGPEIEDLGCPFDNDAMSSRANSYSTSTPEVVMTLEINEDQIILPEEEGHSIQVQPSQISPAAEPIPSSSSNNILPIGGTPGPTTQERPVSASVPSSSDRKRKKTSRRSLFDSDDFNDVSVM